jgi:hypothetical protein
MTWMPSNAPIIAVPSNDLDVTKLAFGGPFQCHLKSIDPRSHRMLLDGLERRHDQRTNQTDALRMPYLARQSVKHEFGVCNLYKKRSFLSFWVTVGPDEQ